MAVDSVVLYEIFRELLFIKLPADSRKFVLFSKEKFEKNGSLDLETVKKLRKIKSRNTKKIRELHLARLKARETNGRRARGLSVEDVMDARKKRESERDERNNDYGF